MYVDASSEKSAELSYRSFVISKDAGSTLDDAFGWLVSRRMNWLIVLDGADAFNLELRSLFPSCSHGNILITTQRSNLPSFSEWFRSEIRVSRMSMNDAANLLWKTAGVADRDLTSVQRADGRNVIKVFECVCR